MASSLEEFLTTRVDQLKAELRSMDIRRGEQVQRAEAAEQLADERAGRWSEALRERDVAQGLIDEALEAAESSARREDLPMVVALLRGRLEELESERAEAFATLSTLSGLPATCPANEHMRAILDGIHKKRETADGNRSEEEPEEVRAAEGRHAAVDGGDGHAAPPAEG